MEIERIIREPKGSVITLGAASYHFRPIEVDGPHVANVDDKGHARLLLGIKEGYRPFGDDAAKAAEELFSTSQAGTANKLDGEEITKALAKAADAEVQKAKQDQQDQQGQTDTEADAGAGEDAPSGEPVSEGEAELQALSDDELRARFEEAVGRKAHHRMLAETMIAQILASADSEE
ncbi:hypothetical protein PAF17_16030 [Paracoccus sp. Z330]|uniref:Mu-like prophage FluMu N-terminal domain-containing protein n=1 Tax=Paracoccus onchidii TaxID=3017813 RepID=A0ABT4ZI52_9RHOB|nr:hypothetical protein [Paracoccus onchidii]MDB6179001.1 hypothetical protein [Paracoccus onchidii]